MSNIKIMQVGNRPFHVHGNTIYENYSVTGGAKAEQLIYSPQNVVANKQWLTSPIKISVSGVHVSMGSAYNVDYVTQELREWIGKPTVIIAYELFNLHNHDGYSCACNTSCEGNCDLVFLQTFGMLKSVNVTSSDSSQPNNITLSFEIYDFWRELDTYTWEWDSSNATPIMRQSSFDVTDADNSITYVAPGDVNYYTTLPSCENLFSCNPCKGFRYRNWENDNLYYDEDFWYDQYNEDCVKREGGDSAKDIDFGGMGVWHLVNSKKGRWNAPPISVYSFDGLPAAGIFSISVQKNSGLSVAISDSTIDLGVLNTALVAETTVGLQTTDKLIVGDIRRIKNNSYYRPSFVQRGNDVIDVYPNWSYSEWFPGMLGTDYSRVSFQYAGSEIITAFSASYVHHFRRI